MSERPNPYAPEAYGEPVRLDAVPADATPPRTSRLAITATILGVIGLVPCCGTPLAAAALLLGIIAVPMIMLSGGRRKGMLFALLGVVLGAAGIYIAVLLFRVGKDMLIIEPTERFFTALEADDHAAALDGLDDAVARNVDETHLAAFDADLEDRYGELGGVSSVGLPEAGLLPRMPGNGAIPWQFEVEFDTGPRDVVVFVLPRDNRQPTGDLAGVSLVHVIDATNGNLTFPDDYVGGSPGVTPGDASESGPSEIDPEPDPDPGSGPPPGEGGGG